LNTTKINNMMIKITHDDVMMMMMRRRRRRGRQ
jgi:hypothetical protein